MLIRNLSKIRVTLVYIPVQRWAEKYVKKRLEQIKIPYTKISSFTLIMTVLAHIGNYTSIPNWLLITWFLRVTYHQCFICKLLSKLIAIIFSYFNFDQNLWIKCQFWLIFRTLSIEVFIFKSKLWRMPFYDLLIKIFFHIFVYFRLITYDISY